MLTLLKEINDLKCKRIDAINKFLNKKINKIIGDISFNTGSAKISDKGISEINKINTELINDIEEWRKYISDCNEKVLKMICLLL